jgi:four helix bundle protein
VQVLKSGTAIGALYRRAQRAGSKEEFRSGAAACLRELDETGYWIDLLAESGTADLDALRPLADECDQLFRIFEMIETRTTTGPAASRLPRDRARP